MMAMGMMRPLLPLAESWISPRARGPLVDAALCPYCGIETWATSHEPASQAKAAKVTASIRVAI